jgi:tetrahydromethanopterin S-methyltransferase subunit B
VEVVHLSTIVISPDFDVVLDAENKVVGEARSDIAVLDIVPLEKKISELEVLVNELANLLSSEKAYKKERLRLMGSFLKCMTVGFFIGLALFCLIMLMYHASSFFETVKSVANLFKPPT